MNAMCESVVRKIVTLTIVFLLAMFASFAVASPAGASMAADEGAAHLQRTTGLEVVEIAAGSQHALALLNDGTLWSWGFGTDGQLGVLPIPGTGESPIPVQITTPASADWVSLAAGGLHSVGIQSDGTLWTWGSNGHGQLGHGDYGATTQRAVPTQVATPAGAVWTSVSAGSDFTLAIQDDGTLWAWGHNNRGRLGLGDALPTFVTTPTQVTTPAGATWASAHAGGSSALAIQDDGTLWSWGIGTVGQLGLGQNETDDRLVPTQITTPAATGWVSADMGGSHALAIREGGTLWAWGQNANGRLGLDDTDIRYVPTQVGNLTAWTSVSAGINHSMALQSNNTLWAWGYNNLGQLGLNDTDSRAVPTQVTEPGTSWRAVSAPSGASRTFAVQSDGRLWSTGHGSGDIGQLGIGTFVNEQTFRLVMPLPRLEVVSVSPAGTNVPVANQSLVITFNQAVCTTTGTRTVLFDGTALTGGTWSNGNTVLTFVLPTPLELDTTYEVDISSFYRADRPTVPYVSLAANYLHDFTTRGLAPHVPLRKTLQTAEGTTLPNVTFTFTFENVQVLIRETPPLMSNLLGGGQSISNQSVTPQMSTINTTAGITTITGELNLWPLVYNLNLSPGGVYVWNVREQTGSSGINTNADPNSSMDYDDEIKFQLRAVANRYGELSVLEIQRFVYDEVNNEYVLDTVNANAYGKRSYMNFVNTYLRIVGNDDNAAFVLTKVIPYAERNQFADRSTDFSFTLTLIDPALGGPIGNVQARVVNHTTGVFIRNQALTAGANTFNLRDNERLVIDTLPAGVRFIVSEAAHPQFEPSARVFIGGTETVNSPYSENRNTALRVPAQPDLNVVTSYLIADSGRNAADFTNNTEYVPPTGIVLANAPYFVVAAIVLALALVMVSRNRKAMEEIPLAT